MAALLATVLAELRGAEPRWRYLGLFVAPSVQDGHRGFESRLVRVEQDRHACLAVEPSSLGPWAKPERLDDLDQIPPMEPLRLAHPFVVDRSAHLHRARL